MYIVNNTTQGIYDVISYIPYSLRQHFYNIDLSAAYEIQLSAGRPVLIYYPDRYRFLSHNGLTDNPYEAMKVKRAHISEAIELASKSSIYSVEDEIRNGFITIDGGHRIGICGTAVIREGKIVFVKEISALNYRLAREVKGAANSVMKAIIKNGQVKSTLIISPPGAGKTTMLRDIVRQTSNMGIRVCVVDERREIAAMHALKSSFDLGTSTSVLSGAPKASGMLMMLRSMSPDVLVTDEIGTSTDAEALTRIINSGTKVITTVHGFGREQIKGRCDLKNVIPYFETFITLSKSNGVGTVEDVTEL